MVENEKKIRWVWSEVYLEKVKYEESGGVEEFYKDIVVRENIPASYKEDFFPRQTNLDKSQCRTN